MNETMKSDEKWAYMMYHGIMPLQMKVEKDENEDHIFIHFDTYVLEISLKDIYICPILGTISGPGIKEIKLP